jgi:hypothetical protein
MLFYGAISSTFAVPSPQKPQINSQKNIKTDLENIKTPFSAILAVMMKKPYRSKRIRQGLHSA